MMSAKRTIAILIVTGVLLVLCGALHPDNALAGEKSIVGSWVVQVTILSPPDIPPSTALVTYTKDHNVINTDGPTGGTGHGAWKKVEDRTFALKHLTLVSPSFNLPFPPLSTITTSADLILNEEGDEITGSFQAVVTDPTGAILVVADGTMIQTRITVDP